MSNDYVFKDRLPVAPLKIAALESCRDLAAKVNDHIINFRRNDAEELKKTAGNLQFRGYDDRFLSVKLLLSPLRKRRGKGRCP